MSEAKLSSVLPGNALVPALPGHKISSLYVDDKSNMSSLEFASSANDITIPFNNKNFGAESDFRFPRTYMFLGAIVATIVLKYAAGNGNGINANYLLYSLIKRIRFSIGGTELLSTDGHGLLELVLNGCPSEEHKRMVLKMAGTPIADGAANGLDDAIVSYQGLIPFPWSHIQKGMKKPLPLHMLSEPVICYIQLADASTVGDDEIFSGAVPTISKANIRFEYTKVAEPKNLWPTGQKYLYPFTYTQTNHISILAADTQADLKGFRKGEVKSIRIKACPNAKHPFKSIRMKNISCLFNGQEIWKCENEDDEIWDLIYGKTPSVHNDHEIVIDSAVAKYVPHKSRAEGAASLADTTHATVYGVNGAAGTATSRCYYYEIPIAYIIDRAKAQNENLFIGADFSKQSLQLKFDALGVVATINVSYDYECVYSFNGENALLAF